MTKEFDKFIEEAASKRCPSGEYYCHTREKCMPVPKGWHVGRAGYLAKDEDENNENGQTGNGHSSNANNGSGGNGNGSNGGGNGG